MTASLNTAADTGVEHLTGSALLHGIPHGSWGHAVRTDRTKCHKNCIRGMERSLPTNHPITPHPGAEAGAGQWPELLSPLILQHVAIGGNGSILGKTAGSFIPFATLSVGSSPAVPSYPSQVPILPPALSLSDLSPPLLFSLSGCPWHPWVSCSGAQCCTEVCAHTASPTLSGLLGYHGASWRCRDITVSPQGGLGAGHTWSFTVGVMV